MEPKICRVCLTNVGIVSLFDNQEEILSYKIMQCVSDVSVVENDGFPDHICSTCESELAITYNFITKCQASDKTLRDMRHNAFKIEIEDKLEIDVKNESEDMLYEDGDYQMDVTKEEHNGKGKHKTGRRKCSRNGELGKIKCKDCDVSVLSVAALEVHRRKHTGERPYECPHCRKGFTREPNLTRHLKQHIIGRKQYVRKVKLEKFTPVQCVTCGLLLKSQSVMKIHALTHTGQRPYPCESCHKTFTTKGCLKRHVETNHLEPSQRIRRFICEMCGRSFYRKAEIIAHIRTHTGEKPHGCPYCPMRFLQISALIRHKRIHTGDRPFACPVCDKRFADKSMIAKHLTVHSDERKHKCLMCEKTFKCKTSLRTHVKLHTNTKDIICSFCGMTFSTKGNLKAHTLRQHSERSGQCSVCMKPFPNLEAHMRKHTGEKPFACSMCSRAFGSKVSLSAHMVFKHENSNKYKCSLGECNKTFPKPSMLEFHLLKEHTNHKPHVCQYCSKGFFRTSDLSRHLKVSHNDVQLLVKVKPPID